MLVSLSSIPTDRETEIVGNLRHRKLWLRPVVLLALVATACGGGATTIEVEESTDDVVEDVAEDVPEPTNEPEETPTADIEPEAVLDPVCGISKGDGPFEQIACDQPHGGELAAVIESPAGAVLPNDEMAAAIDLAVLCAPHVATYANGDPATDGFGSIGYTAANPGEPYAATVDCWFDSHTDSGLHALVSEVGYAAAVSPGVVVTTLAAGTCVTFVPSDLTVANLADCSDPEADTFVGFVDLPAESPYPSNDQIEEALFTKCPAKAESENLDVDLDAVGGTVPYQTVWAVGFHRLVCVAWHDEFVEDAAFPSLVPGQGCATYDDNLAAYVQSACDVPHSAEFVGSIAPRGESLPADAELAQDELADLCQSLVSDYVGRPLTSKGVGIGFNLTIGLGDPYDGEVDCFANVFGVDVFDAAISEVGLQAAMGNHVFLSDLDAGLCFVFVGDNFNVGLEAPCLAPDALMALGTYDSTLGDVYPGDEALRAEREIECAAVGEASGLSYDPDTVSGTFPTERAWKIRNHRLVSCDATPM